MANKNKEVTADIKSLQHDAFADSQSVLGIFTAVAEQVSRIMAPEEESAKTFYCQSTLSVHGANLGRMPPFLLPVYVCQCDTLQRHLQVDDGCSEGRRAIEGARDCLLHCAGARQHLSGDRVQVDEIARFEKQHKIMH